MQLLLRWLINGLMLLLVAYLFPSITLTGLFSALFTALLLGLVNALIRPVLLVLTLPITVLTLGLFTLVINGLLFWLVSALVPGFHVAGFWSAFWGALVYSVLSWVASTLIVERDR